MLMIRFPTLSAASEALADRVAACIHEVLAGQPRACLALPGGTTPGLFLRALGERPVDWRRVTVLPGDERFVPLDDLRSNERQIRLLFAPARDGACDVLSLRGDAATSAAAAASASARLKAAGLPDIAIFGMGDDGHIASLFPGAGAGAWRAEPGEPVIPAVAPDGSPRLSLSPSAILAVRSVMLLISGADKQRIIEQASCQGPIERLPVRLLLQRDVAVFSSE